MKEIKRKTILLMGVGKKKPYFFLRYNVPFLKETIDEMWIIMLRETMTAPSRIEMYKFPIEMTVDEVHDWIMGTRSYYSAWHCIRQNTGGSISFKKFLAERGYIDYSEFLDKELEPF